MEAIIVKILIWLPVVVGVVLGYLWASEKISTKTFLIIAAVAIVIGAFFLPIKESDIPMRVNGWAFQSFVWYCIWCTGVFASLILAVVGLVAGYLMDAGRWWIISLRTPTE